MSEGTPKPPAPPPQLDRGVLRGWKAIAAFLEVDVRTVQRWHKRTDIPIRQLPVDLKSHPVADAAELERWLRNGGASAGERRRADASPTPLAPDVPLPGARKGRVWAAVLLSTAVVVAAATYFIALGEPAALPHAALVDGERVVVRNVSGQALWERVLPGLAYVPQWELPGVRLDNAAVFDADGDGSVEVLVNVPADRGGAATGSLVCFEADGRERWRFTYGRAFTWRHREFSANFSGRIVRPLLVRGRRLVLAVAWHSHWFPSQVALLEPGTGRLVEEYWHPGAVYGALQHDLDGDGAGDLLLAGVSNPGLGLGRGVLTVLDLPPGARRAPGDGMSDFTGGRERRAVLLPRPDVCGALGLVPIVAELLVAERKVQVRTNCAEVAVFHTFDLSLDLVDVRVSDNYAAVHGRLEREGLVSRRFHPSQLDCLGRTVPLAWSPDGNEARWDAYWQGCE